MLVIRSFFLYLNHSLFDPFWTLVFPPQVYACEFVIESSSMGFMISDKDKNVVLFMYQPEARESNGGHRLIKKTDFHLGQHVNTFFKIRLVI